MRQYCIDLCSFMVCAEDEEGAIKEAERVIKARDIEIDNVIDEGELEE